MEFFSVKTCVNRSPLCAAFIRPRCEKRHSWFWISAERKTWLGFLNSLSSLCFIWGFRFEVDRIYFTPADLVHSFFIHQTNTRASNVTKRKENHPMLCFPHYWAVFDPADLKRWNWCISCISSSSSPVQEPQVTKASVNNAALISCWISRTSLNTAIQLQCWL